MRKDEDIQVRLTNGDLTTMKFCGEMPLHRGQRAIVLTNGIGCFAARETSDGWVIINEPVKLYPV